MDSKDDVKEALAICQGVKREIKSEIVPLDDDEYLSSVSETNIVDYMKCEIQEETLPFIKVENVSDVGESATCDIDSKQYVFTISNDSFDNGILKRELDGNISYISGNQSLLLSVKREAVDSDLLTNDSLSMISDNPTAPVPNDTLLINSENLPDPLSNDSFTEINNSVLSNDYITTEDDEETDVVNKNSPGKHSELQTANPRSYLGKFDQGQNYICSLCHYNTNNKNYVECLDESEEVVTKEYVCIFCNYQRKRKESPQCSTEPSKTRNKKHSCTHCDFQTDQLVALKKHVESEHNLCEIHTCTGCGYQSQYIGCLKKHIKTKHNSQGKVSTCKQCGFQADSMTHLQNHIKSKHSAASVIYKCAYCSYSTGLRGQFNQHMKRKHKR